MDLEEIKLVTVNFIHQLHDAVHEGLGGAAHRMFEDLLRRTVLVDHALVHEEDAGGHIAGETHFVRDDEHGHAVPGQLPDDAEHLSHHRGVQGRCRFVEKDHLRMHGQRPGNGHALFLPAGEGGRIVIGLLGHADLFQQFHRLFPGLFLSGMPERHGGEDDVFQHGLVFEEIEALEHHAHLLAQEVQPGPLGHDVFAVHPDFTAGGRFQHVDGPQQGALAGAGRADDADDLSPADLAVHILQDGEDTPVRILEGLA